MTMRRALWAALNVRRTAPAGYAFAPLQQWTVGTKRYGTTGKRCFDHVKDTCSGTLLAVTLLSGNIAPPPLRYGAKFFFTKPPPRPPAACLCEMRRYLWPLYGMGPSAKERSLWPFAALAVVLVLHASLYWQWPRQHDGRADGQADGIDCVHSGWWWAQWSVLGTVVAGFQSLMMMLMLLLPSNLVLFSPGL